MYIDAYIILICFSDICIYYASNDFFPTSDELLIFHLSVSRYIESVHSHHHSSTQHHHQHETASNQLLHQLSAHYHLDLTPITKLASPSTAETYFSLLKDKITSSSTRKSSPNDDISDYKSYTSNKEKLKMDLDILYEDGFLPRSILLDLQGNIWRNLIKNIKVWNYIRIVAKNLVI